MADAISVVLLLVTLLIGTKAIRAFRQSKLAVTESASLLGVIVNALTSRIQVSESVVNELRSDFDTISQRSTDVESEQARLRANYLQLLRHLHEALTNDRRLIVELQQLKIKFGVNATTQDWTRSKTTGCTRTNSASLSRWRHLVLVDSNRTSDRRDPCVKGPRRRRISDGVLRDHASTWPD